MNIGILLASFIFTTNNCTTVLGPFPELPATGVTADGKTVSLCACDQATRESCNWFALDESDRPVTHSNEFVRITGYARVDSGYKAVYGDIEWAPKACDIDPWFSNRVTRIARSYEKPTAADVKAVPHAGIYRWWAWSENYPDDRFEVVWGPDRDHREAWYGETKIMGKPLSIDLAGTWEDTNWVFQGAIHLPDELGGDVAITPFVGSNKTQTAGAVLGTVHLAAQTDYALSTELWYREALVAAGKAVDYTDAVSNAVWAASTNAFTSGWDGRTNLAFSGYVPWVTPVSDENYGYALTVGGRSTNVVGAASFTVGQAAEATGRYSVALGRTASAVGTYSTAIGTSAKARGTSSVALMASSAEGNSSLAAGVASTATATGSIAVGTLAVSSNKQAIAIGIKAFATNDCSIVLNATASTASGVPYGSHGDRTINIGVTNGIDGVWIWDKTLRQHIKENGGGTVHTSSVTNDAGLQLSRLYDGRRLVVDAGVEWSAVSGFPSTMLLSLVDNGSGRLVASSFDGMLGNKVGVLYSNDGGSTWSPTDLTEGSYHIAFGNGVYIAVGGAEYILTSTAYRGAKRSSDGIHWADAGVSDNVYGDVVFDGTRFVLFGVEGDIKTSSDGTSWATVAQSGGRRGYSAAAFCEGTYVAADCYNRRLVWSTDLVNWTETTETGSNEYVFCISVVGPRTIICCLIRSGEALISRDCGHSWDYIYDFDSDVCYMPVRRDGVVYLPGRKDHGRNAVCVSTDNGVTWSLRLVDHQYVGMFYSPTYDRMFATCPETYLDRSDPVYEPCAPVVQGVSVDGVPLKPGVSNVYDISTVPLRDRIIGETKEMYVPLVTSTAAPVSDRVFKSVTVGQRTAGSVVGQASIASGYDVSAAGNYSAAFGSASSADGSCSLAVGSSVKVDGMYSLAAGLGSQAGGMGAVALGRGNAVGNFSLATGYGTVASNNYAMAMGHYVLSTNKNTFTWSGVVHRPSNQWRYGSHGEGSFSVYPEGGVTNFWVGEERLVDLLGQGGGGGCVTQIVNTSGVHLPNLNDVSGVTRSGEYWDVYTGQSVFRGICAGPGVVVGCCIHVIYGSLQRGLQYSTDGGQTWRQCNVPSGCSGAVGWALAYGNGMYMAASLGNDGNGVLLSTNGVDWVRDPDFGAGYSVSYGGFVDGRFHIAYGPRMFRRTSYDGYFDDRFDLPSDMTCTAFASDGHGTYVVCSDVDTTIMYSKDGGSSWSAATVPEEADPMARNCVAYGNGRFVAIPGNVSASARMIVSEDGVNWTYSQFASPIYSGCMVFNGGRFIIGTTQSSGSNFNVLYSDDGIEWTSKLLTSVAKPGGEIITGAGLGYDGTVYLCTNGETLPVSRGTLDPSERTVPIVQGVMVDGVTCVPGAANVVSISTGYKMVDVTQGHVKQLHNRAINDLGTLSEGDYIFLPEPFENRSARELILIMHVPANVTFSFPLTDDDLEPWSLKFPNTWKQTAAVTYRISLTETRKSASTGKPLWEIGIIAVR